MGAASWLLPLVLCRTTGARKLPDSPKLARSGEAVAWNSLCKRYEHQKPVDARGVGSGAVAVFVHARDVSSYCGRVIDLLNSWAPRFPHAYAILRNNTLDDGAPVTARVACVGSAAPSLANDANRSEFFTSTL